MVRLNKFIAAHSSYSRRQADALIAAGRVTIDGRPARVGEQVEEGDRVGLDGRPLQALTPQFVYLALNKPPGILSTTADNRGRKTVLDLVKSPHRLFPVGRLDYESSGLLILTNDGNLALKLTHPRYHLPKIYEVELTGHVTPAKIKALRSGVQLEDGRTLPARVRQLGYSQGKTTLEITLTEGRKRQIRRMGSALHLHVVNLRRTAIGPIRLGSLALGQTRPLTLSEVTKLKHFNPHNLRNGAK